MMHNNASYRAIVAVAAIGLIALVYTMSSSASTRSYGTCTCTSSSRRLCVRLHAAVFGPGHARVLQARTAHASRD